MDKLKIRRYRKEDDSVVWELHKLGLAEIGVKLLRNGLLDKDLRDVEGIYLNGGDFIVGEYQGKVVAMGAFKRNDDAVAELKRMRVHPDFQSRGFGQAILDELEKRARKLGFKKIILDTSKGWIKAQNLYRKNGYIEMGRNLLNKRYNAIFYEKELT